VVGALVGAVASCSHARRGDGSATTADRDGPSGVAPSGAAPVAAPLRSGAAVAPASDEGPFFIADPAQRVVPILRADAPNVRYGRLGREACEAELGRRGVPFLRGEPTEGVLQPVRPPSPASTELWGFVCDAARSALFNVMLTPNYNTEHRNHFHLEITPEAGWMMVK
jgi:hypothetical protein